MCSFFNLDFHYQLCSIGYHKTPVPVCLISMVQDEKKLHFIQIYIKRRKGKSRRHKATYLSVSVMFLAYVVSLNTFLKYYQLEVLTSINLTCITKNYSMSHF